MTVHPPIIHPAVTWETGSRCGSGEEPVADGVHLRRVAAVAHPRVLGGVEYGEPGRNIRESHRRVSACLDNVRTCCPFLGIKACCKLKAMCRFVCSRLGCDSSATKIFVNGCWVGIHRDPEQLMNTLKKLRRQMDIIVSEVSMVRASVLPHFVSHLLITSDEQTCFL